MKPAPWYFPDEACIPRVISGTGVLFLLVFVGEWLVFTGIRVNDLVSGAFLVSLFIALLFAVVIFYIGYGLERSDLPPERYPRIAKWFGGGMAFYLAINVPLMVVWSPESTQFLLGWARFAVTVGGVGGLLVGVAEARAIQRERAAERAAVRAEEAETHHRHLDYLNGLLRHEVLNSANVITGYASLLLEDDDLDATARERVETIDHQGRDMTNVIRDVRVLLETTQGVAEMEVTDLSAVVAAEVDDLRHTAEAVEIEASIPDDVRVVADDLLPRVFSNLLTNAVEHHDGDRPRVSVSVAESAEAATVRVADDGPGISPDELPALFDRGDNTGASHGLGLYLVRTLAERYGGTATLVETGDDGSEFAVTLPTATPGGDEAVARTRADSPAAGVPSPSPND